MLSKVTLFMWQEWAIGPKDLNWNVEYVGLAPRQEWFTWMAPVAKEKPKSSGPPMPVFSDMNIWADDSCDVELYTCMVKHLFHFLLTFHEWFSRRVLVYYRQQRVVYAFGLNRSSGDVDGAGLRRNVGANRLVQNPYRFFLWYVFFPTHRGLVPQLCHYGTLSQFLL